MQVVDVSGTTHEHFLATLMKAKGKALVQNHGIATKPRCLAGLGNQPLGQGVGRCCLRTATLAAGCRGSPGLKFSERRHFAVLLVSTVTGDPVRRDISPVVIMCFWLGL